VVAFNPVVGSSKTLVDVFKAIPVLPLLDPVETEYVSVPLQSQMLPVHPPAPDQQGVVEPHFLLRMHGVQKANM
jgi:hypothetical protein